MRNAIGGDPGNSSTPQQRGGVGLRELGTLTGGMQWDIVEPGMTVAIGIIDPSGEIAVAADTREYAESPLGLRDGALKSVRLNSGAALVVSGDAVQCNVLVANLYGRHEEAKAGCKDTIARVERDGTEADGIPFVLSYKISSYFSQLKTRCDEEEMEYPRLNAILVGREKDRACLGFWLRCDNWKHQFGEFSGLDEPRYAVTGPGNPPDVRPIFDATDRSVWERIAQVAGIYRELCPCAVNEDIQVRRAADDFAIRPLSVLFSNSPSRDP